jgi:TRAP-type C4-dicarboxylate transport system substrate-binding protein
MSIAPARNWHASIIALMVVVLGTPAHCQQKDTPPPEIRLSTALGGAYPLGRAGERWAQLINDSAAGAFEVRTYPGATLAQRDPAGEFGALRDGRAHLAVGAGLSWSAQLPALAVYALPWLAPEPREQQALAANAALRAQVMARMADAGVVALAIVPLGERVLATMKAPIETPAACAGLRVRVLPLRPVVDVYRALGAQPQTMAFAEAQRAFAAGALDGQDAQPTTLVATRALASGQKFVTRWGAFADVMIFAVHKASWDAWPEERRRVVRAAALQSAQEANAIAREEAALADLNQQGLTIVRLSSAQRAALRDMAHPAIAEWTSAVGADLAALARDAVASAGN